MCGLVGIAGRIETVHKQIFRDMLTVCQIRGRDSTGVISVKQDNTVDHVKMVGTPEFLLDTKKYERQCEGGSVKALIGHTRAKTIGAATQRNAHPFEFDSVIGVHNGTLRGDYGMENRKDFEVDSEWLYWFINRYGIENAIPEVDEDGAWALTYWNKEQNTLNMLRNKERPLWITYDKDCKVMMWASEAWFFSAASRRIDLWDGGETKKVCFQLDEDKLLSMEIDSSFMVANKIFTMKPLQEIKGKEVRKYTGNNWQHQYRPPGPGSTGANPQTGGQVADPFQAGQEVVRHLMAEAELDDDLPLTMGPVLLLPDGTKTPAASTTSSTARTPPVVSSQNTSDLAQASKSSTNGARLKESRQLLRSKLLLSEDSGSTTKDSNIICGNFRNKSKTKVSLRQVSGIDYITDHKSGREFSEQGFENVTGCKCMFCRSPIGGLEEVAEIFAGQTAATKTAFICTSCVSDPQVAVH